MNSRTTFTPFWTWQFSRFQLGTHPERDILPCIFSRLLTGNHGLVRGKKQRASVTQVVTDCKWYLQFYQKLSQKSAGTSQACKPRNVKSVCSAHKADDSSAAGTSRGSEGKSPSALPRAVLLSQWGSKTLQTAGVSQREQQLKGPNFGVTQAMGSDYALLHSPLCR